MKLKKNFETKIVFFSNTLGSFLLGFYFASLKTIGAYILGAYCLLNIFCFCCLLGEDKK